MNRFSLQSVTDSFPECAKQIDGHWCGVKDNFLKAIFSPLDYWFVGFFDTIFWSMFVLIVFLKYKDPLYAGLVGLIIITSTTAIRGDFTNIGFILIVVSIGMVGTKVILRNKV